MSEDFIIKPHCDMMINQNKFIGSDPIGHCCMNEASFQTETHFICESCAYALDNNWIDRNGDKVSVGIGSVTGWKERTDEMIKNLMKPSEKKYEFNFRKAKT